MKTLLKPVLAGVLLAALSATAPAAEQAPGLYYNVEGGPNFAQQIDISAPGYPKSVGFDTGYRFGATLGYHLDRQWSMQFDTGYLYNSAEGKETGSISHIPLLFSGRWNRPLLCSLEGYLGAGIGSALNSIEIGTGSTSEADQAVRLAWQLSAGLSYPLADNMSIGFSYQYMGTRGTDYRLGGIDVDTGVSHNHSFGLSFHLDF